MSGSKTDMENNQPLAMESFSYKWLVSMKPSLDMENSSVCSSLDVSDEASFIEMDPNKTPSKRFFKKSYDFKFDFPASETPRDMVHADELFSNGYVMPAFFIPSKLETSKVSDSSMVRPPDSPHTHNVMLSPTKIRHPPLRRCCNLSREVIQKYLNLLKPLVQRVRNQRMKSPPKKMDSSKVHERKNRPQSSPRFSVASSIDDWRTSCDSDCSIYEAVLHCKRSIGQ